MVERKQGHHLTKAPWIRVSIVVGQTLVRLRTPVTERQRGAEEGHEEGGREGQHPTSYNDLTVSKDVKLLLHSVPQEPQNLPEPHVLCELDGSSSGKGPGCPFPHVCRNLFLVLVAQKEEGESHGGEVELLQQPVIFYTPENITGPMN